MSNFNKCGNNVRKSVVARMSALQTDVNRKNISFSDFERDYQTCADILKLPIPSNERGFNGKITVPWQPLLLPLINGSTVYYRSRTVKQVPVTQSAHA